MLEPGESFTSRKATILSDIRWGIATVILLQERKQKWPNAARDYQRIIMELGDYHVRKVQSLVRLKRWFSTQTLGEEDLWLTANRTKSEK